MATRAKTVISEKMRPNVARQTKRNVESMCMRFDCAAPVWRMRAAVSACDNTGISHDNMKHTCDALICAHS